MWLRRPKMVIGLTIMEAPCSFCLVHLFASRAVAVIKYAQHLPGLVITCYITGTELHWTQRAEIIQYLRNLQAKDGGWGLYVVFAPFYRELNLVSV